MASNDAAIREGRVTANGLDFAYLACGDEGPLALCMHGFPDSAWSWRHLLPALAASGYRAVAPFLRGYAPTSLAPDGVYQAGAIIADITALHDALGGDGDAVLIGHDWGAIAAYGAAALEPQRWRRVVTGAVPPLAVAGGAVLHYDQIKRSFYIFFFQTQFAEMVVGMNDLEFIERLWGDWSPGYDATEDLVHVKDALRAPGNLAAAIGYYRTMLSSTDHSEAYRKEQDAMALPTPQPTLYLHGATDGCLGLDLVKDAAMFLPAEGSRMEVVENAGHFLQVERPDEVNALILDFLSA